MRVELVRASVADQPALRNLLELYLHDFSEIDGNLPANDGRFNYPHLYSYWSESGRFPLLIRAEDHLAGFVLVSRGSKVTGAPSVMDVSEFFVVRGLRRRGVGIAAAIQAFGLFAGPWEVRVMERNTGAQQFWQHVVSSYTHGHFESAGWQSESGTKWLVLRFGSPASGAV